MRFYIGCRISLSWTQMRGYEIWGSHAAWIKMAVYRDVMSCNMIDRYRLFWERSIYLPCYTTLPTEGHTEEMIMYLEMETVWREPKSHSWHAIFRPKFIAAIISIVQSQWPVSLRRNCVCPIKCWGRSWNPTLGMDVCAFISSLCCPVFDRLCGLVVRVLGYRSGGPGSIPGTTRKKSSGSGTGSTQPREYNWGATW
jgi:hypothetical protein